MPHSITKMIFSIVILLLISVPASQEASTGMEGPEDTSVSQQIITTVDSTETTFLEKTNSKVTGTRFNKNTGLTEITQDQETEQTESPRTQTPTYMTSGDTSETLTTTQQTIIQQTTTDVTNNTQTTSSQSLLTILTTESAITIVNSTETFSEKPNRTAAQGDREGQDVAVNPGLIAVLCIFCIVMAVVVVVVIVKAVRSRRPHFERLDDVSMGKMSEDAPFAHYPPK